jgi:hypothetical protein
MEQALSVRSKLEALSADNPDNNFDAFAKSTSSVTV